MDSIDAAVVSGNAGLLLWTALVMGFVHTVLGPDHYVPFVALAKSAGWTTRKLTWMTVVSGIGHVGSSVVLGAALAAIGLAAADWETSSWASWHESRAAVASWLLMGLGAAIAVHGVVRSRRARSHEHDHAHADGTVHVHGHDHRDAHLHPHEAAGAGPGGRLRRATPWVLFLIFVFGPCESLIPLVLAAAATGGLALASVVALAFSLSTIATMLACVFALRAGLSWIPSGSLERHATTLAGASLVLCGAGIEFLGL